MSYDTGALVGSHDLRLPAWGPYTKHYMGISHVPDVSAGLRFDLSVFPALYRRSSVRIPDVHWEAGYHPWEAAPDLSYFSHRHEMIWKDQLYCDVSFARLDDDAALICARFTNRTGEAYEAALHYMASLHFPPLRTYSNDPVHPCRVVLPAGAHWIDALSYVEAAYARPDPLASLSPDGQRRGEVRDHGFVDGQGLGQGFGAHAGDRVCYYLGDAGGAGLTAGGGLEIAIHCRMAAGETLRLALGGAARGEVSLAGTGDFSLATLARLPGGAAGAYLVLTALGGAEMQIDGLIVAPPDLACQVRFEPLALNYVPDRLPGPRADTLLLRYEQVPSVVYGLAWGAAPFDLRELCCDDLDTLMRHMTHEHVRKALRGRGDGHFTNVFMRPILLEPGAEQAVYGLVCAGPAQQVHARLAAFDPASPDCGAWHSAARRKVVDLAPTPAGAPYRFGQERMAATLLTNVVYPVRTRGTWIRHSTPGRWWDCLYTWDSGFIGLGLLELDVERAVDNLNAYVTEPGEPDAAFIHHGSPVPTQFYLFQELWNRTQSPELLMHFYPRLRQYHRFMAGRLGSSTTRSLKSSLLKTWDYFYNSGGWDDYPPQVYVHAHGLEPGVAPAVTTSHVIRSAKIMRMAALALGEDVREYEDDIVELSAALLAHAWDEEAGYFSYVEHDPDGRPTGFLRHPSGANFNMGLDGASPLLAGICTPAQEARLLGHLRAPDRLWSPAGITAVDQSAPYYRIDGYWNGTVWMAHQWFFWKALLDMGQADDAHRVACTALGLWEREVSDSYNCYEHFTLRTGRGAGWHHFGGLSAPVLKWYGAYFRPGRLSTGLDAWVEAWEMAGDHTAASWQLRLFGPPHRAPMVIVTMHPGHDYAVTWNGAPLAPTVRYSGTLEIGLPAGSRGGRLDIRRRSAGS